MISFLSRHRKALFIATISIFLLGTFVGLGGYLFTSRDTMGAVASVGSVKIPYLTFINRVNQIAENARTHGADVGDKELKEIKQMTLRDMIVDEILLSKSGEMGIVVTDDDLARDVRNTPAFQRNGAFDQDAYFQTIRTALHDSPEGYEESRRKQLAAAKLKQLLYYTAKLSPEELKEAYAKEHKGSLKGFEKDKDEFAAKARQQRAVELINYYLRQLSGQMEIRSYLDQRESGT